MIFNRLKRSASDPAPTMQATAAPVGNGRLRARLVLEALDGMTLVGWCADAEGGEGEVSLWLADQRLDVAVERQPRADVATALGVGGDAPHGFRIPLPATWRRSGAATEGARLTVQGAGLTEPVPAAWLGTQALADWARSLRDDRAGGARAVQFPALVAHLAQVDRRQVLDAALMQWFDAEATLRGCADGLDNPDWQPGMAPVVQGRVESAVGLAWSGWAHASNGNEHFNLLVNGQAIDCSVVRVERADVKAALNLSRLDVGFDLELPSRLWSLAGPDGRCELELHVQGQRLADGAHVLDHDSLAACVRLARQDEARVAQRRAVEDRGNAKQKPAVSSDVESPAARSERQYRLMLCLEHVTAAGMLDRLPDEDRAFILAQIDRYKLHRLLPTQAPAAPALAAAAPALDINTRAQWQLQREFNRRLLPDGSNAEALLNELQARPEVGGELRQRWLASLVPFFCGRGAYTSIRPFLDAARLRENSRAGFAADLSMQLPELVLQGEFKAAAQVFRLITAGAPGWLNTECIGEAIRLVCDRAQLQPDTWTACRALTDGFLDWLRMASRDYWSRLHDRHICTAAARLAALADCMPDALSGPLLRGLIRSCALVPGFWEALAAHSAPGARWPAALRDAHASYQVLHQRLRDTTPMGVDDLLRLAPLLTSLDRQGCAEAPILLRELLLACTPRLVDADDSALRAAFGTLGSIHRTEALRLAAHPLAGERVARAAPALSERIAEASGVPMHPHTDLVSDVARRLSAWSLRTGTGVAEEAARCLLETRPALATLARGQAGALGVHLAAVQWLLLAPHLAPASSVGALTVVRDHWCAAFEEAAARFADVPAALVSSWSLLDAHCNTLPAAASAPDDALRAVCQELEWRLVSRLGPRVAQARTPATSTLALRATRPDRHTLVVIYSCRANLGTRIQRIRDTWMGDLRAAGIPHVVLVGDGDGRLDGDVLALPVSDAYEHLPAKTLAMIEWVAQNTDFQHLLKIDDDCHLAVEAFLHRSVHAAHHYLGRRLHRNEGDTDRIWHRDRSRSELGADAIDKSPEPSTYADGGAGYCLSRLAMTEVVRARRTQSGAQLSRSAFMEDKLLGDLLALSGIGLANEGHQALLRRRFGAAARPVNAWQNTFYPGPNSPTLISHLDDAEALPGVQARLSSPALAPGRLWPSHRPPVLGGVGDINQLELLSPPAAARALDTATLLVVAVARNERILLPHFLAHYRALGVQHFVLVDNLSDDGTREYLLSQPDVVLYSADTEYRHSHFGVSWQQAVLAAHGWNRWVVLADIDEFLLYPGCEQRPLADWVQELDAQGHDAALTLMVDMYPDEDLSAADLSEGEPFDLARWHDRAPLATWQLGSGSFSNGSTWVSALRHRLIPDSAPNSYTSQKVAVLRYQPWVRLSEGLHYAANLRVAPDPVCFAHFKYHAGFSQKVQVEVARKQHFNGAGEYRKYLDLLRESQGRLHDASLSVPFHDARTLIDLACGRSPT